MRVDFTTSSLSDIILMTVRDPNSARFEAALAIAAWTSSIVDACWICKEKIVIESLRNNDNSMTSKFHQMG